MIPTYENTIKFFNDFGDFIRSQFGKTVNLQEIPDHDCHAGPEDGCDCGDLVEAEEEPDEDGRPEGQEEDPSPVEVRAEKRMEDFPNLAK